MKENLEPDKHKGEIIPYPQPQSDGEITLPEQLTSDLDAIGWSLVKSIEQAETPEEKQKIVAMLPLIEEQKERRIKQDMVKFQMQETENAQKFNRKMEVTKEIAKMSASLVSVGIGFYLTIDNSPLLGPLFIILGLAGTLQYSLKDVSQLLTSFASTKDSALSLLTEKQDDIHDEDKRAE